MNIAEAYIVIALISTMGMFGSIAFLNHNWFKRKKFEYDYQLKRFKLGKKYKLQEYQLPKSPPLTTYEKVKAIDMDKVNTGLELLAKSNKPTDEEEFIEVDLPEDRPSLVDSALDFAKNNPEKAQELAEEGLKFIANKLGDKKNVNKDGHPKM